MSAPTPAAVRCALTLPDFVDTSTDEIEALGSDPRTPEVIVRDHLRAVAAELRSRAEDYDQRGIAGSSELRAIADKLEGLK